MNMFARPAFKPRNMNRFLTLKTPALVLGVLLLGALSVAQNGGDRKGHGFGGGGGRGGNQFGLLRRTDVRTDLQLSTDQITKLDELMTSMRGQRGNRGEIAGGQPG